MNPELTCSKCSGRMQEGFVMDESYASVKQSKWVEGKAEVQRMAPLPGHVRIAGDPIAIAVFRCESCGFLESYAKSE